MRSLRRLFIQFFKFGVVGVSNTAIGYAVYAGLIYVNLHYIFANIMAFILGTLNSFYWNNKYVFVQIENEKRNLRATLIKMFVVYFFVGCVISNVLLYVLIEKITISKYIAYLLQLVVTVPLNFLSIKYWVFSEKCCKENGK